MAVSEYDPGQSSYVVLGDNGAVVDPAEWTGAGGNVLVDVDKDSTRLTLRVIAPTLLYDANDNRIESFSLALPGAELGENVSSLVIRGSGLQWTRRLRTIRTAVPPELTETEVGATLDNPFIVGADRAFSAGVRVARAYAGSTPQLSGTVSAITRRGDSGAQSDFSYDQVQTLVGSASYSGFQSQHTGQGYTEVLNWLKSVFIDPDVDQVFGNVAGARVWDRRTRRWFRVTSGTSEPGPLTFSAEDDLQVKDMQSHFSGLTYSQVAGRYNGMSYRQVDVVGMLEE